MCGELIAEARVQALPGTNMCITCVQEMGDVARIRRYDDWDMNMEECSETLYFSNQYFDHSNQTRGQVGYTTVKEEGMA